MFTFIIFVFYKYTQNETYNICLLQIYYNLTPPTKKARSFYQQVTVIIICKKIIEKHCFAWKDDDWQPQRCQWSPHRIYRNSSPIESKSVIQISKTNSYEWVSINWVKSKLSTWEKPRIYNIKSTMYNDHQWKVILNLHNRKVSSVATNLPQVIDSKTKARKSLIQSK